MKFCVRKFFSYSLFSRNRWKVGFFSLKKFNCSQSLCKEFFFRSVKNIFDFLNFIIPFSLVLSRTFEKHYLKSSTLARAPNMVFSMLNDDDGIWLVYICWRVASWSFFIIFHIAKCQRKCMQCKLYIKHMYFNRTKIKCAYEPWTIQPKTISICTSKSEYWVIWIILCILCISRVYVNSVREWNESTFFSNSICNDSECKVQNYAFRMWNVFYELFCHLIWCLICNESWLIRLRFQMLSQLMDSPWKIDLNISI